MSERGWLLLYTAAVGCALLLGMYTMCIASAVGQLLLKSSYPPSLCWSIVPCSYDRTADYGRKRNNENIHTPRNSAESTRNVHRNIYRLLPCVPRSRKLLLLLLLLCCCKTCAYEMSCTTGV